MLFQRKGNATALLTGVGKELLLFTKVFLPHSPALSNEPLVLPFSSPEGFSGDFYAPSCPSSFIECSVDICCVPILNPAKIPQHFTTARLEQRVNEASAS